MPWTWTKLFRSFCITLLRLYLRRLRPGFSQQSRRFSPGDLLWDSRWAKRQWSRILIINHWVSSKIKNLVPISEATASYRWALIHWLFSLLIDIVSKHEFNIKRLISNKESKSIDTQILESSKHVSHMGCSQFYLSWFAYQFYCRCKFIIVKGLKLQYNCIIL
jgi:hypothetical protein